MRITIDTSSPASVKVSLGEKGGKNVKYEDLPVETQKQVCEAIERIRQHCSMTLRSESAKKEM